MSDLNTTGNSNLKMSDRTALISRNLSGSSSVYEGVFERIIQPCLTEFIGVALFVFIGTTAICSGAQSLEAVALAHGLAIALLVTATGSISGGHFNPAVTLGVFIAGHIEPLRAVFYIISHLVGGILGAAFTLGVVGQTQYDHCSGGGHTLSDPTLPGQGVLCEILLTYLLVTTVLLAAVDSNSKSSLGPIAIGFAVTVDILAGGAVTGASMNPARSFGPAVVFGEIWGYHWIYWVGPGIGSIIAGSFYRLFLASPEKRLLPFLIQRN